MKKVAKFLSVVFALCMACSLCACGGGGSGDNVKIAFVYEADPVLNKTMYELVKKYNDTQGVTDKVSVDPKLRMGVGDEPTTYTGTCEFAVALTSEKNFKNIALDGLFSDLTDRAEEDSYDISAFPTGFLNSARLTVKQGEKSIAGEGQRLLAMPFGADPHVLFYNKKQFENEGINIISATEEELANNSSYASVEPHGYAEYKNKPYEGANSSQNLAGETVYKVFNNRIAMNWEELRYLSKVFTREYNGKKSGSTWGYSNEWWFPYAWSVGSDCIGWDGEKYRFTLMDEASNWLVTKQTTINGKSYSAGEIVTYEDKTKEQNIENVEGLHKLPSQRDALTQFLSQNIPTSGSVATGWGTSPFDQDIEGHFTAQEVAMAVGGYAGGVVVYNRSKTLDYDVAPLARYREFEGGSVYYSDSANKTFANEYLKVIGEKYSGDTKSESGTVYTGKQLYENNTAIVGAQDVTCGMKYLVLPTNCDSSQKDAAWSFIKWACGEEGQKILAKASIFVPANKAAYSDFEKDSTKNLWAATNAAAHGDIPDWAYFENGEWVTAWSTSFNGDLRKGAISIKTFMDNKGAAAESACNNTSIVIRGRDKRWNA